MEEESRNEPERIATKPLRPGYVVMGRYEIVQRLGTGGMASVYTAKDRYRNDTLIALKALHKDFVDDKTHIARFIREVQLLNKLNHPNVVRTFDIGHDKDLVFFTMEYVEGESLEALLDRRQLGPSEIAKLLLGICDGLSAVHAQGIFHRDLKPGNFIVQPSGLIKIIDFGVAREKVSNLTLKVQVVGSVCYVAPEIWLGKKLTRAADFYGLGVVLYEMTTGIVPFESEHTAEIMRMHIEDPVVPPERFKPEIPKWLNHLCLWLLKKNPKQRPQSAEEIIEFVISQGTAELAQKTEFDKTSPLLALGSQTSLPAVPGRVKSKPSSAGIRRSKTYIFRLSATEVYNDVALQLGTVKERKKATFTIPLPRHAAAVIEIEAPSVAFIFLGVFLASLQLFDGVLTHMGIARFTTSAEGNPLLRFFIEHYGPEKTLVVAKLFAISLVLVLTILAKRTKWIKHTMAALCVLYLAAAIIPWIYLLLHG